MIHQVTEAVDQLRYVSREIYSLEQLLHCLHDTGSELDKVISDKTNLVLHPLDDRVYQGQVLEDTFTIIFGFGDVEVALEEDDLEKIQ